MTALNRRSLLAAGAAALGFGPQLAAARRWPVEPVGLWTELADMPFAVQEIYPTAFWRPGPDPQSYKPQPRGVLVNAGGIARAYGDDEFVVSDNTVVYDPILNEWGYGTKLPEARHHLALVYHNGFLYALNGFAADTLGRWRMQSSLWRIDDLTDPYWRAYTPPPMAQAEAVAVSLNGHIHIVGGRSPASSRNRDWRDHIDTDRHWVYDARLDSWAPRRPMPTPRNSAAGAVVGNALYVIGGRTVEGGNTPVGEVYEPGADRWQSIAPMPRPYYGGAPRGHAGAAAAAWNDRIYVFGGEWFSSAGGGVYADVWEYDPREDRWRSVAAMPRPRHGLGAVALSDGIYVCGGASNPSSAGTSPSLDRFEI